MEAAAAPEAAVAQAPSRFCANPKCQKSFEPSAGRGPGGAWCSRAVCRKALYGTDTKDARIKELELLLAQKDSVIASQAALIATLQHQHSAAEPLLAPPPPTLAVEWAAPAAPMHEAPAEERAALALHDGGAMARAAIAPEQPPALPPLPPIPATEQAAAPAPAAPAQKAPAEKRPPLAQRDGNALAEAAPPAKKPKALDAPQVRCACSRAHASPCRVALLTASRCARWCRSRGTTRRTRCRVAGRAGHRAASQGRPCGPSLSSA